MADSFLSPLGDYEDAASFCGVKTVPIPADFRRAVDAAASAVRGRCGPVLLESGLTHTTRAACYELVLPFRVAALTSLTDSAGTVLTLADYYVEPHHLGGHGGQVVRRVDGGQIPACTVVYSSGWGYVSIPAEIVGAGLEIARQHWRSQLGNQRANDDQQGRAWSVDVLADRYVPNAWTLAPLGFA